MSTIARSFPILCRVMSERFMRTEAIPATNDPMVNRTGDCEDGIMFQGSKWHNLTPAELERNNDINRIRKAIEHVFGTFKRVYRFRRCKYFSLVRNRTNLFALCISNNLKRSVKLQAI